MITHIVITQRIITPRRKIKSQYGVKERGKSTTICKPNKC